MPHTEEIDTETYFRMAARFLVDTYGTDAMPVADQALEKMRRLGDDDGLALWQEVRRVLAHDFAYAHALGHAGTLVH